MPQVVQQGAINLAALAVADVYVQIVPPQLLLNGIPTNIVGVVGTASWGPVGGAPGIVGDYNGYVRQYGPMQPRKYDAGTAVWNIYQQGQSAGIALVRVTDGTDVAATVTVLTNCITFTSKYTGSLGNGQTVSIAAGSAANTFKATINHPGQIGEVFDNIAGTGNAFWVNLAAAINAGQSGLRGPSNFIIASAGVGTTAPATATYALATGTDGAATITGAVLIGSDVLPRKGMYALRGSPASIVMLTDCDDTTTWTNQVSFGLGEGMYMIATGVSGESINSAIANKATAGIDSYAMKLMLGDWVYFLDTTNGQRRLISPQSFVCGTLGNLAPNQSSLNKPMFGIVGTQKSITGVPYTGAELQALANAGIDVICNPIPYGNVFGCRNGRNTSSNAAIRGDNYTRMTNFIAFTIAAGTGKYIGLLQTPDTRRRAKVTLDAFFANMQFVGLIGTPSGADAWQVKLDEGNNPFERAALGYMTADVKVTYLSVIEFFVINIEGGQTVKIDRRTDFRTLA